MLYIILDQYDFLTGDYGRTINGIVYQEDRSTVFNLTGYTLKIRVLDDSLCQTLNDITGTISTAASGTFSFATTVTNTWNLPGYAFVELELSKSGEITSCNPARVMVVSSPYP